MSPITVKNKAYKKPKRWKTAIIVWIAIIPLVFTIPVFITPKIIDFGFTDIIAKLLSTTTIVVVMVYILIPLLTKIFDNWLNR